MQQMYLLCLTSEEIKGIFTFLTVVSLIASIADAGAHNAYAVSSTVDVNALVGWHITFSAFPPTVALAATTGVLAVTTTQHRTGSWTRHKQEDGSVRQTGFRLII